MEKLRMAVWVAEGVADVHGVDWEKENVDKKEMNEYEAGDDVLPNKVKTVPLIHNDINMDNVLLGHRDGVEVPLLNDFNIAVFRKKDAKTGEACRFRGRFANPQVSECIPRLEE